MTFWQGFYELPQWFVMLFLGASLIGLFFVVYELANRKMRIDKTGITFDRMREKKPLILRLIEARSKKRGKIDIQDVQS